MSEIDDTLSRARGAWKDFPPEPKEPDVLALADALAAAVDEASIGIVAVSLDGARYCYEVPEEKWRAVHKAARAYRTARKGG